MSFPRGISVQYIFHLSLRHHSVAAVESDFPQKNLRQSSYLQPKVHFEADDTDTPTTAPQRPLYLELKALLYNLFNVTCSLVTGRSPVQSPKTNRINLGVAGERQHLTLPCNCTEAHLSKNPNPSCSTDLLAHQTGVAAFRCDCVTVNVIRAILRSRAPLSIKLL